MSPKNKSFRIVKYLDVSIGFVSKYLLSFAIRQNESFFVKLVERIFFYLNQVEALNNYLTIRSRPKKIYFEKKQFELEIANAILIQGQIQHENSFTLETIRIYTALFPSVKIILSTWNDQELKQFYTEFPSLVIIESQKPEVNGFLNFNLQHITTNAGIEMAEKLGIKRLLKTRTDQRFYNENAISFLNVLIEKFPSNISLDCMGRIFFINLSSLENIPYHLSDMLHFGYIEDIKRLWKIPLHKNNVSRDQYLANFQGHYSALELVKLEETNPEIYIGRNYAEQFYAFDRKVAPLEVYEKLLSEAVGIVDKDQLDFFWPKYHAHEDRRGYHIQNEFKLLTYSGWMVKIYMQA